MKIPIVEVKNSPSENKTRNCVSLLRRMTYGCGYYTIWIVFVTPAGGYVALLVIISTGEGHIEWENLERSTGVVSLPDVAPFSFIYFDVYFSSATNAELKTPREKKLRLHCLNERMDFF